MLEAVNATATRDLHITSTSKKVKPASILEGRVTNDLLEQPLSEIIGSHANNGLEASPDADVPAFRVSEEVPPEAAWLIDSAVASRHASSIEPLTQTSAGSHTSSSCDPSSRHASRHASRPASPAAPPNSLINPSPLMSSKPPIDPLDSATLKNLLQSLGPKLTEPFTMAKIIKNPDLARAARKELDSNQHSLVVETDAIGTLVKVGVHDVEVERQQAAVAAIVDAVVEESKVNKEITDLLLERLDCSRRTLESLVKLLQGMAAAESAYAAAMHTASRAPVSSEGTCPEFRACLAVMSQLPVVLSQAHRQLHGSLTMLAMDLAKLLDAYKVACKETSSETAIVQRRIEQGRRVLLGAFDKHAAACRSFDMVLAERARGHAARAPDLDPWATEGRLVQEHKALQQWQDRERCLLKRMFERAQQLEAQRLQLMKQVVLATADNYRAATVPLHSELDEMVQNAHSINPDVRLGELTRAATTASEAAEALAARQAESIEGVCQELFCSPEIIRQGEMQHWDTQGGVWVDGHFVLTRAGFLHWFKSLEDVEPLDVLNLSRCQFEAGKAPCFNIVESKGAGWLGVKQRKCQFQASSVEECCEWAIAIRESIAVACGTSLPYEEG